MEFIGKTTNIDFLGARRIAAAVSLALIIASLALIWIKGLNYGIDFTGGTLVELGYERPVELSQVRKVLGDSEFGGAVVQYYGTAQDILVRLAPRADMNNVQISTRIVALLDSGDSRVEVRRIEFVGAQVGEELVERGGLAMLLSLAGILVYIALRFQIRFAIGAVAALLHDPIITIGFFALADIEFDLTVLAAVLAVIGYSLNDTIVIFDRVRENFRRMRSATVIEVFNKSVNQTLGRTIITGGTTILVLVSLYFWGGSILKGFALALFIGVLVGTYSSVYVASPVCIALGISRKDLLAVEKEGADVPARP